MRSVTALILFTTSVTGFADESRSIIYYGEEQGIRDKTEIIYGKCLKGCDRNEEFSQTPMQYGGQGAHLEPQPHARERLGRQQRLGYSTGGAKDGLDR